MARGVQSRKLSNVRKGQSSDGGLKSNLQLLHASECFGRHVKLLVPAAFAVVNTYFSFKGR
jgi:hypothetical protein